METQEFGGFDEAGLVRFAVSVVHYGNGREHALELLMALLRPGIGEDRHLELRGQLVEGVGDQGMKFTLVVRGQSVVGIEDDALHPNRFEVGDVDARDVGHSHPGFRPGNEHHRLDDKKDQADEGQPCQK